ncbi:O-antigen ligase family protein [Clostridium drakei]|uniref:Polymerase n=1 Tax=Clostridium drakei TaxID=332101 RepID=A0A2U8DVQ7_9CLOT|nr:O-antigen ligase family protein [Clostridium drakei]AWI06853.1 polymerase [Clostridium drakei]
MFLDILLYCLMSLYIILLPLMPNKVNLIGKSISPADAILSVIVLIYLLKLFLCRDSRKKFVFGIKDFFSNYLTIFMSILALIMLFSISYATEKGLALSETIRFITYIIIFFIIKYENKSKGYLKILINSYICSVFITSLFGIYQYFTGFALNKKFIENYGYAKIKIAANMDNPNNLGAFLVLAIFPVLMIAIYEKNKLKKAAYVSLTTLMLIDIALTGSRNAIVGIIVGVVVLAVLYSFRLFILLGFLGIIALFVPQVRERLLAITDKTQNESRTYLWEIAKKMIKDHPLFGVGNGNYVSLHDKYTEIYPQFKFYGESRWPCHNSYLKIESELGIIGGISFLGILITSLLRVKKFITNVKDEYFKFFYTGFLASMIAFYVMNLVDNLFFVPKTTAYFWILLAICEAGIFHMEHNDNTINI